ncbi:MAG: hypothetical protein V3T83_21655 [Acidobacteriota bacterium]
MMDLTYTVVGIMPDGFDFPPSGRALRVPPRIDPGHPERNSNLQAVARIRPGASFEQADREIGQAALQYPLDLNLAGSRAELEEAGWGALLQPLQQDLRASPICHSPSKGIGDWDGFTPRARRPKPTSRPGPASASRLSSPTVMLRCRATSKAWG